MLGVYYQYASVYQPPKNEKKNEKKRGGNEMRWIEEESF